MRTKDDQLLSRFYQEVHELTFHRRSFFRNVNLGYLAELFLINAVGAIIVIRVYLHLTGYPQLGGGGLHIAHMLWGGFFMLVSIALLLFYLDRVPRYLAAIIGGIGFGTFIDELGKFITSDNDYFYKPTFAFIYLLFISLFLAFRWIFKRKPLSRIEYLVNVFELFQDAADGEFNRDREKQLRTFITKARLSPQVAKQLRSMIRDIVVPEQKLTLYQRTTRGFHRWYHKSARTSWFRSVIALFFAGHAILAVIVFGTIVFQMALDQFFHIGNAIESVAARINQFRFFEWGLIISSTAANILIIIGLYKLRTSYYEAFRWFRWSIRVSIFFVNFFAFYHQQLIAVSGALFDIALLYTLRFMIVQEKIKSKH